MDENRHEVIEGGGKEPKRRGEEEAEETVVKIVVSGPLCTFVGLGEDRGKLARNSGTYAAVGSGLAFPATMG